MMTSEKTYDAWKAPHLCDEVSAKQTASEADNTPRTGETEQALPKAGLLAQVAGLKAEEDKLKGRAGGTADQLTEEEKLAMSIAPQGFGAQQPRPLAPAAPVEKAGSDTEEDEDAESEMIREASPFVRELIGALKTVYDPEIPVDIFELGLIYKIDVDDDKNIKVDMTLTAPGCPVAGEMPIMVENALKSVVGVKEVDINMVFDPPWTPEKMSEEARLSLNMF